MFELIDIIWKWKYKILLPTLLAMLISYIASMPKFMPPKYASTATFYAANPSASDRSTIFNSEIGFTNYFGGGDDLDRILTIANSNELSNFIVNKFELVKHYNQEDLFYTLLQWGSNYEVKKNDLDAIEITIKDTDAALAKDMTLAVISFIDSSYKALTIDSRKKILQALKAEYSKNNNLAQKAVLEKSILEYEITANNDFSTLYIIEQPSKALKKCSPIRWMILVGTLIGALFFFTLLVVIVEKIRQSSQDAVH